MAVLLLPVLEILALAVVGSSLGFFRTIALFILLSIFGAWVFKARLAALATTAFDPQGASGVPAKVGSSVLAILGGGLIMLPGFITGIIGLALQLPPVRAALAHRVSAQFTTTVGTVGGRFGGRGDVIDVDLAQQPEDPNPFPSSSELT